MMVRKLNKILVVFFVIKGYSCQIESNYNKLSHHYKLDTVINLNKTVLIKLPKAHRLILEENSHSVGRIELSDLIINFFIGHCLSYEELIHYPKERLLGNKTVLRYTEKENNGDIKLFGIIITDFRTTCAPLSPNSHSSISIYSEINNLSDTINLKRIFNEIQLIEN